VTLCNQFPITKPDARRHSTRHRLLPNYWRSFGTKLLSIYLQPVSRYWPLCVSGSRRWPFRVTWRHRSRDRWTRDGSFAIGGPLDPNLYLYL